MEKTALIIGGSRGIGAATVAYFATKGYRVAFSYNKSAYMAGALKKSLNDQGYDVIALPCDISVPAQVKTLFKQAHCSLGQLDVVVNNAGVASQMLITDVSDDEWRRILDTNLSGTFYACREATQIMVGQKKGSIVNVSSIWGITGASMEVAYSATKAGIIGLTKALAKELGPSNIRVNCIAPGVIDTEMNKNLDIETFAALADETPLGRIGTAQEIAASIFYLADEAEFITGQVLSPNGGMVI